MSQASNILIVKTSSIGDVVHALPIARLIKEYLPNVKVGWVVRQRCADLLRGNPYVDRVHVIANKPNLKELLALRSQLRREAYDTCLDMQGLALSGLISLLSGAKRRIGLDLNREQNALFLTDATVPGYKGEDKHAIDILKGFLPKIGIPIETEWPTVEYLAEPVDDIIAGNIHAIRIGLNLGASNIYKQWIPERWIELLEQLTGKGFEPVLIGGPAERNVADEILNAVGGGSSKVIDAVGRLSLRQSAGIIKSCAVLVSPDSGMLHIGVAVGTPVVGLFGSTNPNKTGPYGEKNIVIWPKIACSPCFRHPTCDGRVDCMRLISAPDVMLKVETLLPQEASVVA